MKYAFIVAIFLIPIVVMSAIADDVPLCLADPKEEHELLISSVRPINECNEYAELLERADAIGNIAPEEFNPKKTKNPALKILKIITPAETDKIINLFSLCGKKNGSENFIRNIILIEARKACIMPSPPGQLSWDEAKAIASKIAAGHKNERLLKMNAYKSSLTKETVVAFADAVVDKNLSILLPDYNIQKKVKANLGGLEELFVAKSRTISEFVSYKFASEAPIELSEKILPHLVDAALRVKLPNEWSVERKDKELKKLAGSANDQLAICLKPFKDRINYGASFKVTMPIRQKLEEEFCRKNPEICAKNSCEKTVNLFSVEASPTDFERIQGCVLQSMEVAIEELTSAIIFHNISTKPEFSLDEKEITIVVQEGKAELKKCLKEKITDYNKVSSGEYTKAVEDCSGRVELNVAHNVAAQLILNADLFPKGGSISSFLGNSYSEDELTKVNLVLDDSLKPCYEKLSSMKPIPSASLCGSIIEIASVEQVLDSRLMKISADPRMNQIRANFRACVDSTKGEAIAGLPTDPTSLLDTRLLGCSTDAIKKSAESIAGNVYGESIEKNRDMNDKKYALGLTKSVEALSAQCISKKLNEIKSWNSFKDFASSDAFQALQDTCTSQVTAFSVSKILDHETNIKLNELKTDGVLSNESPSLIVSSSTEILRKKAGLPPFEKGADPIESLYLAKLARDPSLTVEKFINDFKTTVSSRAIQTIHKDLMAQVRKHSDHPKLDISFNEKCLGDIFTKFEKDLKSKNETSKTVNSPLNPLAKLLSDGFSYTKSISPTAYDQSFSNMKSMCTGINKYPTLGDFLGDSKLAFLFEARIQKELISSFTKVANDNYNSAAASLKGSPDESKLLPFAVKQKQEMLKLISDKLQNSANFQNWITTTNLKKEINSRIPGLIGGDAAIQSALSEKVVAALFNNKSDYGFASEFTRIQLTSNLGIKGLAEARKTVKESVKDLKGFESGASGKIYIESLKSLNKHWTPKEIAADLDWHNLKAIEREKLVNDLYQNAVVPETSVTRKPANMDIIEKSFTHILETAKTTGNKTFNKKLEDKISADVKKEVGFWDALGGWLRPITAMPIMPMLPL